MNTRFKELYGKPKSLTDHYDECSAEATARLLRKPEEELGWADFNMLYRVGVAPASYEEGLYFLPESIALLRRNANEDGINCVADVMWFISEYAKRLAQDGLLDECREQVRALLTQQTREFKVLHWDKVTSPEKCGQRDYCDHLQNSALVGDTLEALLRFRTLRGWAEQFLTTLLTAGGEPLNSAWFLALVSQSSSWVFFNPALAQRVLAAPIKTMRGLASAWDEVQRRFSQEYPSQLTPDRTALEYHADRIRNSGDLFTSSPTYWVRVFKKLGIEGGPTGSEAQRRAGSASGA